jgi:K+-transporting ATPase A subunit
VLRPLEAAIYKLCGIDEAAEQRWTAMPAACSFS